MAVGCPAPEASDPPPSPEPSSTTVEPLDVVWAPSPLVEAVWSASWTPPATGEATVEITLDDAPVRTASVVGGAWSFIGGKAGRTYRARVVHTDPLGARWESPWADLVVPDAPVPSLDVEVADPARMEAGTWVLATVSGDPPHVVIWDRDGDPVWWRAGHERTLVGVLDATVGLDGVSVVHAEYTDPFAEVGGIVRTALDGSSETFTAVELGHHDFAELPSGGFAALSVSLGTTDDGTGATVAVQSTAIVEVSEGASADDSPQVVHDLLADYVAPWPACSHVTDDVPGLWRYDHANSLVYDADRDAYWMLARNLDAILVIDRATGALLHQLGGRDATIPLDDPFDHGHFSWRAPGRLLVFDNRLHTGDGSRVVEYAVDLDAGTAEAVWAWADPEARTMLALSDADALPSGNVLSTWTRLGTLLELAPDGTVVWQATTDDGTTIHRADAVGDPGRGHLRLP